jgi:hypothetical protein
MEKIERGLVVEAKVPGSLPGTTLIGVITHKDKYSSDEWVVEGIAEGPLGREKRSCIISEKEMLPLLKLPIKERKLDIFEIIKKHRKELKKALREAYQHRRREHFKDLI